MLAVCLDYEIYLSAIDTLVTGMYLASTLLILNCVLCKQRARWTAAQGTMAQLEFEQICYFSLWFCSDLLFLLSNLFRSVIPGSPVSNGVVPTDLGQVVKYRGGGDTNTNVVAVQIHGW